MLKNKNIFITGIGKGIGKETCKACIENGAFVYAITRSNLMLKNLENIKT